MGCLSSVPGERNDMIPLEPAQFEAYLRSQFAASIWRIKVGTNEHGLLTARIRFRNGHELKATIRSNEDANRFISGCSMVRDLPRKADDEGLWGHYVSNDYGKCPSCGKLLVWREGGMDCVGWRESQQVSPGAREVLCGGCGAKLEISTNLATNRLGEVWELTPTIRVWVPANDPEW